MVRVRRDSLETGNTAKRKVRSPLRFAFDFNWFCYFFLVLQLSFPIMVSPIKQAPIHASLEDVGAGGGIQTLNHRIMSRVFYHCADKANNMNGRKSTVNKLLDGSIYPG